MNLSLDGRTVTLQSAPPLPPTNQSKGLLLELGRHGKAHTAPICGSQVTSVTGLRSRIANVIKLHTTES